MTTAMYYVGGPDPDNRDELRYSLRSIDTNTTINNVWVVGDVPAWFTGTKMPLEPRAEKFPNARQSIETFVNYAGAPDTFWLFMDDIYVTEPVKSLPIIHLGSVLNNSTYADHELHRADYAHAMRNTTDHLIANGHTNPMAYTGHTPVVLETQTVRDFLRTYPAELLLEPYQLYIVAGVAGPGRLGGNAKCKNIDNLAHKLALDIPYLSSNPDTWAGQLGDHIRSMFPTPCRFEEAS